MKHLKKFDEMMTESVFYNKSEMIELILTEMDADLYGRDELRKDLEDMTSDEFEKMTQQCGYRKLDPHHWTPNYSLKKTKYTGMRPE
jgi:hypothetical protein